MESISAWAVETLLRPILILITAMLLFNLPTLLYKIRLTLQSIVYLLFCHDKSWKKPQDPGTVFAPILNDANYTVKRKIVMFVRHGESNWNDTFNKGKHRSAFVFAIGFIPGLIKAISYELYLLLSGKMDSWFYDSPLSHLGLTQVDELANFLDKGKTLKGKEQESVSILRADPGAPPSILVSSSLRRSLSTVAAAFRERLARRPDDKILVVPSLQEISRNPDTLSITPAQTQVTASWIDQESKICDFQGIFTNQTDMSLHMGNKPVNTNGLKRMTEFCDFCFTLKEDHVIVGGHSIWFRYFFRTFLPYTQEHVSKQSKIANGGVVSFTLLKATKKNDPDEDAKYMIVPDSIEIVYGGFS